MKKIIIIIGLLLATPTFAANILQYDPTDTVVPNRVLKYMTSMNTPDYLSDPNDVNTPLPGYLIHPDISLLDGIPKKYWKVQDGLVVEMTQAEKDTWDVSIDRPNPVDILSEEEKGLIEAGTGIPISGSTATGVAALAAALYAIKEIDKLKNPK